MTIKRMTFLQELLNFMGLEGRLHLDWISSAEAQKFAQVVTAFTDKVKAMGPSPLTGELDLSAIESACEAEIEAKSAEVQSVGGG
ncbi:MAG: hydrogenase iron-sulfur subunit [Desulfobacteraceae bacterium]|uniref:Hydrogenase iron-sulfur subunit n=1 Tax=Candidatus Desulfatibia vada TaxID=2841696 RepID=A0A8J6NYH6_9BACT|nr:hydrogenase iron-sulfur subunit [Candidatus Desulfatibia vada]NQT70336.1 hydrogenase iron-sulfur subunit [Desulfobacteraceae bacterium]